MPTYNQLLDSHNAIFIAASNGAAFVDASNNALTVNQGASTFNFTLPGFRNTSLNRATKSTEAFSSSAAALPPSITHTPTTDLHTITMWFKMDDPNPTNGSFPTSAGHGKLNVFIDGSTNTFNINVWGGTWGIPLATVADSKWNHIAITTDSTDASTTRMWVNGVEQSVTLTSGTVQNRVLAGSPQPYFFSGGERTTPGQYGYPSNQGDTTGLAWFEGHLTEEQIQEQANHNFGEELDALTGLVWGKKPFAYWKFFSDDPNGVVVDMMPGANNLGIYNSHTRAGTGLPGEGFGGKATLNPGGYAHTSFDSKWDVIGVSQYSVEMWIEINSLPPSTSTIMGFGSAAGMNSNLMIRDDMQTFRWEIWNGGSLHPVSYDYELNTLYHIVFTQDTDGRRLYVNGELVGFHSTLTDPAAASDRLIFNFNEWEDVSRNHYTVYEVAYYKDRTLTPVEVSAHNSAGGVPVSADNAYKGLVKDKNPVAYYPCDTESVTSDKLFDVVGGHTLTIPTGASLNASGLNSSQCYNQANSNTAAHIELPIAGQTQVAVEGWVKRDTTSDSSYEMLFGLNAVGAASPTFRADINTASGNSSLYCSTTNAGQGNTHSDVAYHDLNVDQWYHLVLNIDLVANRAEWFLDGVVIGYTNWQTVPASLPAQTGLTIGAINNDNGFGGCFQHLAVYDRLLTPAEIKQHHRARVPALQSQGVLEDHILADDPIGYFPLDATGGTTAVNLAGRNDGTYQVADATTLNAPGLNLYHKPLQRSVDLQASQWIDCGDPVYFGMKDAFTFEQLFVTDSVSGEGILLSFLDNSTGGFGLYRVNDTIRIWFYDGTWKSADSASVLNTSDLYHIVFTFDGQYAKVYLNGVLIINHDFGGSFSVVVNKIIKLAIGCTLTTGVSPQKPWDGRIAHTAVYDYVVPESRHMARTRLIHGDVYSTVASPYLDVVMADEPFVYFPLNDKHANFYGQFLDMGQVDNKVRLGELATTTDSYQYEQTGIVVGGGDCVQVETNVTDNSLLVEERFPVEATGDITLEAWVNLPLTVASRVMSYGGSGESLSTNYAFWFDVQSNGSIEFGFEYGSGTNEKPVVFPAGTIQANTTYHIVLVRNNATKEMYGFVNGVKSSIFPFVNVPVITNPSADNQMHLFGGVQGDSIYFNGKASHVAMYNKVLSDAEINDHYQAGLGNAVGPFRQVTGTVTEDSAPVARNVYVYDRADGSLQGQTVSSGVDGTFDVQWRNPDVNKRYFIVVLDDDGQTLLDPVSRDRIEAVDV